MSDIEKGDQVRLKSGSPFMMVEFVENKIADCVWYDAQKRVTLREHFDLSILEKAPDKP